MADCNLRNIEVELGQKLDQTAIIWLSLPSFCLCSLCSQAIKAKILIAWLTPVCHKSQTHCQPIRSQDWEAPANQRPGDVTASQHVDLAICNQTQ